MILIDGNPLNFHAGKTNFWVTELQQAIKEGKTITLVSLELSKGQCEEQLKRILNLASVKPNKSR